MALYSQLNLTLDGILLAENTSIETSLSADIQDVMTIKDGWKGITPRKIMRTVSEYNVIPLTGVEVDFENLMLKSNKKKLKIQEIGSGKTCVTRGYITEVPRAAGVGATVTISFTFRGTGTAFE
jgi:hypothetical protein